MLFAVLTSVSILYLLSSYSLTEQQQYYVVVMVTKNCKYIFFTIKYNILNYIHRIQCHPLIIFILFKAIYMVYVSELFKPLTTLFPLYFEQNSHTESVLLMCVFCSNEDVHRVCVCVFLLVYTRLSFIFERTTFAAPESNNVFRRVEGTMCKKNGVFQNWTKFSLLQHQFKLVSRYV